MESLITALVEVVKVTFIWRECQHFVRNCQIQCTNRCELLVSSGPPSSGAGHASRWAHVHVYTWTFMHGWPRWSPQTENTQHPHRQPHPIPPADQEGSLLADPRCLGSPPGHAKPQGSLPLLLLRPPLTTIHRLVRTKRLPRWSTFRPLGSPVSKPQACVCLVTGFPDLLSFLLLVRVEVHTWATCTYTHIHTQRIDIPRGHALLHLLVLRCPISEHTLNRHPVASISQPLITAPNRFPFGDAISGSLSESFGKTVE